MITKLVEPKSNTTFNVEKVKLNKLPRHFNDADRETHMISINGKKVAVKINRERTQYVAFSLEEVNSEGVTYTQHYYVRDHKFVDNAAYKSLVKAKPEVAEEAK